jgi:hypothetical protein
VTDSDIERARELAGLMDRIQSDPGGKLDRILEELAAIRSALGTVPAPVRAPGSGSDDLLGRARHCMQEYLDAERGSEEEGAAGASALGAYDTLDRSLSSGAPLPSAWGYTAHSHRHASGEQR